MASKILKELAASLGFEEKSNRFFGDYQGYSITLSETNEYKYLMIGVALSEDDPQKQKIVEFIEKNKKAHRIVRYSIHSSQVSITVQNRKTVGETLKTLMDEGTRYFNELGIPGSQICWYCKQPGGTEKVQVNEAVITMHNGCIESFSQKIEQAALEFHSEKKNYGKGFIGALLGAIVGAIPWLIVYLMGYLVALLGILIGFASQKGYELMGGKPGKGKAWIVLLLVIVVVVATQFVGDIIELTKALADEGIDDLSFGDVVDYHKLLLEEHSEYRGAVIGNLIKGLLFAVAGAIGIFIGLKEEGKGGIATIKRIA